MKLLKGEYPVHAFVSPMDVGELLLPLKSQNHDIPNRG